MKKIILGSDHGGFELKQKILGFLSENYSEYEVADLGCDSADSCNYPIFGKAVAEKVVELSCLGIIICGSGIGISIAANRVNGARAVLANSSELAKLGRQHNGANILSMGERTHFIDSWQDIVHTFLATDIDLADRHQSRRDMIDQ